MNVLITSAASPLAHQLAREFYAPHNVTLTDIRDVRGPWPFVHCDLGHDETTDRLVENIDVLIHLAMPPPECIDDTEASANWQIDYHTRRTYNLLLAASNAGVPRCIYASSLSLFAGCDDDWAVNEQWRPRPSTAPEVVAQHLGEFTCREFAREGRLAITCLRLGNICQESSDDTPTPAPTALSYADAVQAFRCALNAPAEPWGIYHIQSALPEARFSTQKAQATLGFTPQQRSDGGVV
jgi:nucleoside-diphosphate-sugar epimerase